MADIDASPSAVGPAESRQKAIESLYISNFDYIRELVFADRSATLELEQQVAEGIAKHLPSYDGELSDSEFRAWLNEIIVPLVGFHAIRRVCEPFVRAAIWRTLGHSSEPSKYDDYPELVRELEQEVWLWVYLHLNGLTKRGTAKITTRVYERAVFVTRGWLKQRRTRRSAVIRHVYNLPRKSKAKADAEKIAAAIDREARESAAEKAEAEEILEEMKKVGLAA